jgi:hypothetical protein
MRALSLKAEGQHSSNTLKHFEISKRKYSPMAYIIEEIAVEMGKLIIPANPPRTACV